MTDHIADLKAAAQRHTGTMGPACMTCAFHRSPGFWHLFDKCEHFATLDVSWERSIHGRCGPEGRACEPRLRRLGLIPWARRLLWGDPP